MLDFYLLGVARSGTSILTITMNLHPDIFCGMERFNVYQSPKSIRFPESFLDESIRGNPIGLEMAKEAISNLNSSELQAQLVGDKLPRKLYAPSHIKDMKKICIYRPHKDVAKSWDVFANGNKSFWNQHRSAFTSFLDLMVFFMTVTQNEQPILVDYNSVYWGDFRSELEPAIAHIGALPERYPFDTFEKDLFNSQPQKHGEYDDERMGFFADFIMLTDFEKDFVQTPIGKRTDLLQGYGLTIKKNIKKYFNTFIDLLHPNEFNEIMHVSGIVNRSMTEQEIECFFPLKSILSDKTGTPITSDRELIDSIIKLYPDTAQYILT